MAAQPPSLAALLAHLGQDEISLEDLNALCAAQGWDPRHFIGQSVGTRNSFWNRLARTAHEPDRVILTLRPPNPPPAAAAGQFLGDSTSDPKDVTKYMNNVFSSVTPCASVPPEVQQIATDEYARFQAQLASGGETDSLFYQVDEDGRTIMSGGMVHVHAPRAKDTAPEPFGGKKHKTPGDHKGHLYAAHFADAPAHADAFLNVVWEKGSINLSQKKRYENEVAAFTAAHPAAVVQTLHEPLFHPGDGRPFAVRHYAIVDGQVIASVILENK